MRAGRGARSASSTTSVPRAVSDRIPEHARSFALVPERYERGRPEYPKAAVDLLVERLSLGPGRRGLDLPAGAGEGAPRARVDRRRPGGRPAGAGERGAAAARAASPGRGRAG